MLTNVKSVKSIFENSPFGTLVTTENGHVEGYNQAFVNLIGLDGGSDNNSLTTLIGSNAFNILGFKDNQSAMFEEFIEQNLGLLINHTIIINKAENCLNKNSIGNDKYNSDSKDKKHGTKNKKNTKDYDIQIVIHKVITDSKEMLVFYFIDWQLQSNNTQLRNFFENDLKELTANIPSVVFRCHYERYRPVDFVSDTIVSLTGHDSSEFVEGRVYPKNVMSLEDDQRVWSAIGKGLVMNEAYTVEYRITNKEGKQIWVSENGRVVTDDNGIPRWIVGVLTDNTAVKSQNAEFEGTVNALNRATAVIEFDIHGHVLRANELFLSLVDYQLDEVIGHHHRMFCSKEQHESPEYLGFWNRLRAGEVQSGEYSRIGKNGKEVWIQATYNPIFDADGKPYKVMKFATDLSNRRQMEQALLTAKEKAEQATVARGAFLANMSHEIRTPMNAIIGFTEQIMKTELDDRQTHFSDIILKSSRSLLRLLNEILDMAKLEEGAVDLEMYPFNFHQLIEQIIATYQVNADDKGIQLRLTQNKNVPKYVNSDGLRVQQILLNMISNAIKFTKKGNVTLDIAYHDGGMEIKVIDTGIGMKQSYLEDIFSPFTQSDTSTSREFGGTGLGTAITHQLVQLMSGKFEVESELGVGSTFTITLPIEMSSEHEYQVSQQLEEKDVELPQLNILAVDDTQTSLELLQITLEDKGHNVTLARDGNEGFEAYKKSLKTGNEADKFDLIITDIQMPRINGFELCEMARTFERNNKLTTVPMIALSANVLEEYRQRALKVGMNDFSTKPLIPHDLFTKIAKVLEESAIPNAINIEKLEKQTQLTVKSSNTPSSIHSSSNIKITKPSKHNGTSESVTTKKTATKINIIKKGATKKVVTVNEMTVKKMGSNNISTPVELLAKNLMTVNEATGLKLWKKENIYYNAINRFLEESQQTINTIIKAYEKKDQQQLIKETHKIRGGAGNLHLDYLYEVSSQIEILAKKDKLNDYQHYVAELPKAVAQVESWLTSRQLVTDLVSNSSGDSLNNASNNASKPPKKNQLTEMIKQVKNACESNQLPHDEHVELVINYLNKTNQQNKAKSLQSAIENFDFKKVIEMVTTIHSMIDSP